MATSTAITVQLSPGLTFNTINPTGTFQRLPNAPIPITFTTVTSTVATVNVPGAIPPGTYMFAIELNPADITGLLSGQVATATLNFVGTTPTSGGQIPLFFNPDFGFIQGQASLTVACLHGSSLIQMREGCKRLDQVKEGDEVLSGKNLDQYTKIKGIAQCWLSFMNIDHDAIIFEPNSLGLNEPTQKLIIDPGHPICTKKDFLEKGFDALRPAGTYWEEFKNKSEQIYTKKWTDIFVQEEPSVRYDLILEEPFNTYVANGIVVRSKGYKDHRYKEFV